MCFFYGSSRPNPSVLLSSPVSPHGCEGMPCPQHFNVFPPLCYHLCYCNTKVTDTDYLMNRPGLTWISVSIHLLHTTKLNRGIMLNCYKMITFNLKFATTHCTQKSKSVTLKIWLSVCTAGHTCIFLRAHGCVCVCVCVWVRAHARSHATLCNPMDCSPPDSTVNLTTKALLGLKEWSGTSQTLNTAKISHPPL